MKTIFKTFQSLLFFFVLTSQLCFSQQRLPPLPPCPDGVTTWNGSSWSNGIPNTEASLTKHIIFDASYQSTEDIFACSVTVNSGATVTFKHIGNLDLSNLGHTLTVDGEVTVDGILIFEDDASLVQITNSPNTGAITYKRRTPPVTYSDYTYWSSPVANQLLVDLSPDSNPSNFFHYNTNIPNFEYVSPVTTIMQPAKGYIFTGPPSGASGSPFLAEFVGVPNTGTISIAGGGGANLVGNPYPSAVSANCFITDTSNASMGGAMYFWSHNIAEQSNGTLTYYVIDDYNAYNLMGGVGTGVLSSNNRQVNTNKPTGYIAAGQSFFIAGGGGAFKNSMRVGSQDG